ncbi:MAG TPA: hypothetical protein VMF05_02585 [Stellaceae bacterium]|nr:hypothetical protein [Stellaceae bacterium]
MTGTGPQRMRDRTLRARNWALFAVIAGVAVLLYAVTLLRIAG